MSYVREKKVPGKDGKVYRYYQLVEGKRVDGKVRQHVIAHLGKHDSIEDARAAASVVPKENEEQKGRYWITVPARLGYDSSSNHKPMYPVFLSKEAALAYGGPGVWPGEKKEDCEVLAINGSELAAALRGARLGGDRIAIWEARDSDPEILTRRAFVKRLERGA